MCVIRFDWLISLHIFTLLPCNASFLIIKKIVRGEDSDVKKSLCKNIFLVSSRLCTSPLVCAHPQLTLFNSPTTPSTPWHVGCRNFPTLEIWQSLDKFTGKHRTQNQYLCLHLHCAPSTRSMAHLDISKGVYLTLITTQSSSHCCSTTRTTF